MAGPPLQVAHGPAGPSAHGPGGAAGGCGHRLSGAGLPEFILEKFEVEFLHPFELFCGLEYVRILFCFFLDFGRMLF